MAYSKKIEKLKCDLCNRHYSNIYTHPFLCKIRKTKKEMKEKGWVVAGGDYSRFLQYANYNNYYVMMPINYYNYTHDDSNAFVHGLYVPEIIKKLAALAKTKLTSYEEKHFLFHSLAKLLVELHDNITVQTITSYTTLGGLIGVLDYIRSTKVVVQECERCVKFNKKQKK